MFNVLVDDVRDVSDVPNVDIILRNPRTAIAVLRSLQGHIGVLNMDNDMGFRDFEKDGPGPELPEGRHILAEYLFHCEVQRGINGENIYPPVVCLVTANCVAFEIMCQDLERYGYVHPPGERRTWLKQ